MTSMPKIIRYAIESLNCGGGAVCGEEPASAHGDEQPPQTHQESLLAVKEEAEGNRRPGNECQVGRQLSPGLCFQCQGKLERTARIF